MDEDELSLLVEVLAAWELLHSAHWGFCVYVGDEGFWSETACPCDLLPAAC